MPLNGNELLTTVHGSHLYGLAHAGSDLDTYVVVLKGRSRQSTDGFNDVTRVPMGRFLYQCSVGVPQALEALWSPFKLVTPEWAPFLESFHPDRWLTYDRYQRTIYNFRKSGEEKKLRHAARLELNLEEFMREGRFNPRLTDEQVAFLTSGRLII